jgi:hypothetical protein
MEGYLGQVWDVVRELPGNAREMWGQAFREALWETQGDMQKATERAWQAFKRQDPKFGSDQRSKKAETGVLIVRACGGTPEWIRLVKNEELILDGACYPCFVDKRALEAVIAEWEQRGEDLVVLLEDYSVCEQPAPLVGWIKEVQCCPDGLWVKVEWTEEGLGYITRNEFGYLSLGFWLDETKRLAELRQARLTNYPLVSQWEDVLGYLRGPKGSKNMSAEGLRLIPGVDRLRPGDGGKNQKTVDPKLAGKEEEIYQVEKFLNEMGVLLPIHGEVSLAKVKQAVLELKGQTEPIRSTETGQEIRPSFREEIGRTIREAIKNGLIKPEQRSWAEVYAHRDWSGFKDFLELADASSRGRKERVPSLKSLVQRVFG